MRKNAHKFPLKICAFLAAITLIVPSVHAAKVVETKAMAVTADPHATRTAWAVLDRGGNAVDAAIAAQWVLNVVEPQSSGIGGGGFFLYYEAATKRIYAFDGREKAPAEAFPEMFLDENNEPCKFRPDCITGGRPVGVPGVLKMLQKIHDRFGSREFSFAELFDPAIALAETGFPASRRLARFIDQEKERLKLFPDSRKNFLMPDGNPPPAGTILKQPDLAATFKLIQKEGSRVFYEGEIADEIVKAVQKAPVHPGSMKKDDMIYYDVKEREPVRGTYRDYDIFSMGPPSSGGTTLLETLNILERHDMAAAGRIAGGVHIFCEAQKLAFQDRNRLLGDPDFVKVPVEELVSKQFAARRAEVFSSHVALPTSEAAVRPLALEASNTTHISIVDADGNMVSFTSTIEDIFGSAMIVPGRGFFLNNELTDFDIVPRTLDGKLKANAPEGEKRPRSSMTPTFVFKQGKPTMIVGSPGGSKIIGIVLNIIVNVLDLGMPLDEAMAAPRVINRDGPIEMEPGLYRNDSQLRELQRLGHPVVKIDEIGNAQAIYFDQENGWIIGASDPRGEGEARGF